ncbi:glycoside hydrolase family 61 protein-like protein [Westerdykella ornata]|uniref:AA9 family lytic polysaccharide monooxygenase n=1 Tax=Westerdykella ornata TaxID=318751 RepID=A0A6A6JSD9_WESOR|nr:glycoside hydrolase family 61 protein-like protein [Westerdykella ornata]KAF2277889.1 glycoside hydrolase family 61 protein-like protein [Westerdykella ornata]
MWRLLAATVGFLTQQASAHGGAANYTVGDIWYPGYDPYAGSWQDTDPTIPQRKWITNEPIFETTNHSLACNFPGTPARASIPFPAGSNISAMYNTWVHTVGPMIAWMTHCTNDDCATFDPVASNADWFKIGEKGLLEGDILTGSWFQKEFSRWDGSPSVWTERVPESLRPGAYLIRHEIVSLHSEHRPQFYPECLQVRVTGQGNAFPGKEYMAKIPGVWSMDQPEINMNPYDPETGSKTEYKIPGPPVWTG